MCVGEPCDSCLLLLQGLSLGRPWCSWLVVSPVFMSMSSSSSCQGPGHSCVSLWVSVSGGAPHDSGVPSRHQPHTPRKGGSTKRKTFRDMMSSVRKMRGALGSLCLLAKSVSAIKEKLLSRTPCLWRQSQQSQVLHRCAT